MKSGEEKACYEIGSAAQENQSTTNSYTFEFHKSNRKLLSSRSKPTPSKWDDAQKWLVGLSTGRDHRNSKNNHNNNNNNNNNNKPRNSNADDRRLLSSQSQKGRDSCSSLDGILGDYSSVPIANNPQDDGETKKIDCNETMWRINKPVDDDSSLTVRSVCVRDMGTEMTPIASQEPSRTGTPLRATTPVLRSPMSSRSSTPAKRRQGGAQDYDGCRNSSNSVVKNFERKGNGWASKGEGEVIGTGGDGNGTEQVRSIDSLETRAMAWDEAEKAKYMARYKREEVKIQAWENHQKRKAETGMRRMEVKAERMKIRAQEKLANKLAATRRIAEEKRANAEAKLNERAARTSERADYIRRTGHLPFSFLSFKLPSLCG
ncbi:LOW QUALITY PROTEIN: probable WRKY transcription factor protein 1 [Dioscorea cayenensis subsp. rotundata]|uniref:LOW QUALITY PROTEIN: probable WRKY transcription factor protein 1 n=1 Tax=Dioscorea cayennensis subsp. rotundata TaxID=55577 RepID=A0AB40BZS8_DIOCR|nr:LOW QUALITY PROTEIN: probable WRKY transcription factor protein 1 [Dioscorea cayenensis subsp. rotundata]